MTLVEILIIITSHYIADFIFQDKEWAEKKSHNFNLLLKHAVYYTTICCGLIVTLDDLYFGRSNSFFVMITFYLITFFCHFITDKYTSRVTSRMFKEGKYGTSIPNIGAFSVIGFDQVLHYFQLFITYYFLFKV